MFKSAVQQLTSPKRPKPAFCRIRWAQFGREERMGEMKYRKLRKNEKVREGDEYSADEGTTWKLSGNWCERDKGKQDPFFTYRRPIKEVRRARTVRAKRPAQLGITAIARDFVIHDGDDCLGTKGVCEDWK